MMIFLYQNVSDFHLNLINVNLNFYYFDCEKLISDIHTFKF